MSEKSTLRTKLITMVLVFGTTLWHPVFCQDQTSEFTDLQIPALGQLIESAMEHSPLLDEQDAMIKIREWQLKSSQNEWGRYILFFSEMRYGSIDIIVSNGGSISYGDKSNTTRYNIGTRLQLSIFDALDLKRKNQIAKEQIEFEKFKKTELERMIKDDVIRLWSKLVSYKEIVAINQDHIVAQNSNMFYAEQQYKAGDIPLIEYARIKEISTRADQEYQMAKKEFRETYLLLESLVGVKLTEMNLKSK
jgi:outer membrane protein TolC